MNVAFIKDFKCMTPLQNHYKNIYSIGFTMSCNC